LPRVLRLEGWRNVNVMKKVLMIASASALMVATGVAAADDKIHDRKENQQGRIAQGVKSGSLTPRETARIEHKEAALNHEIRRDRRQNGGNLTNNEKAQINRQQNRLSRDIYRQKHDAQHQ